MLLLHQYMLKGRGLCPPSFQAAVCSPDTVAVLLRWDGEWESWKLLLWNSDSSVERVTPQISCCPISFAALGWSVPGWGEPLQKASHCEEEPHEVMI